MPPENEAPEIKLEVPEPAEAAPAKGWPASMTVSIAAVAVTAIVGILGTVNTWTSQKYEEEKNARDFMLGCVSSAATVAQMAFKLSSDFKDMPDDEKINQVNIIIASFPPDTASRFLTALASRVGTSQSVISAFQVAQQNLSTEMAKQERAACPNETRLIGVSEASAIAAPPPAPAVVPASPPTAAAPPVGGGQGKLAAPAPAPPAPPPAVVPHAVTIYYQITQREDANYARMIANDVAGAPPGTDSGARFPSAGVQLVSAAAPLAETEVRYYRTDQDTAASDLKDQILEEAQAKGLKLTVRSRYIGDKYPNLPSGRMEVWFQPLTKAHQG
jgi:hypothetical protein